MSEPEIRAAWEAQRFAEGVEAAFRAYSVELAGYLQVVARDDALADDLLAEVWAAIFEGFSRFSWRSSFRTWAYAIAHRTWARALRSPERRKSAGWPTDEMRRLAGAARTATQSYLRTESKEAVRRLRARLDPAEQALLTLRIDRGLAWNEVAEILADGEDVDLVKESAALRKKFERLVGKLRGWARADGLLE